MLFGHWALKLTGVRSHAGAWEREPACQLKMGNLFFKEFSENNFPIIDIVRFEVNVL